jgi:hypothetical protein
MVAPVGGGVVVLLPAFDPFDRAPHLAGDVGEGHLFGVEIDLAAEAPAHVGRDDPDLVLFEAVHERQQQPDQVRRLGGGPHRELAGAGVPLRHHAAGLHGVGDKPLVDDALPHHHPGFTEGLVGVAPGDRPIERGVVGSFGVQHRRTGGDGPLLIGHRGQRLELGPHRQHRVSGAVGVLRHHRRDDVALEADLVDRDHRMGRHLHVGQHPAAGHLAHLALQVGAGEHRHHSGHGPGRRGIDTEDAGVGVGTAYESHGGGAWGSDIGHVLPLAVEQPGVLPPFHPLTDLRRLCCLCGH